MLHVVAEEALSVTKDACCEPSDCRTGRLRLGGIVLAAGAGSRLGGRAKGLIEIEGEPLVERTLRVLREVGVDELVVVTGHYRAQLESWLESAAVVEVTQPLDTHTQADSLRLGVAGLSENIDAVMVLPTCITVTTRMLTMLSDTTVTGRDVTSLLSVGFQTGGHLEKQ